MPDAFDEIRSCLRCYPETPTSETAREWILTGRQSVAAALLHLTEEAPEGIAGKIVPMLKRLAGQTWRQVADPDGPAQELWRQLGGLAARLRSVNEAEVFVCRQRKWLEDKLEVLGKYAGPGWCDREVQMEIERCLSNKCVDHARGCRRWPEVLRGLPDTTSPLAHETEIFGVGRHSGHSPALGDFFAQEVMDRLERAVELVSKAAQIAEREVPEPLSQLLEDVRDMIWRPKDAAGRQHSLVLVQACLAGTNRRSCWKALLPIRVPADYLDWHRQVRSLATRFDERTGQPVPCVRAALEWLVGKMTAAAKASLPTLPMTAQQLAKLVSVDRKSVTRWLKAIGATRGATKSHQINLDDIGRMAELPNLSQKNRQGLRRIHDQLAAASEDHSEE